MGPPTASPDDASGLPGTALALGSFDEATRIVDVGEGRYRAQIDPGWSTPIAANGGYLAAILVRAIEAHLGTPADRQLRSLTCHYLRPVTAGPLDVRVEVARAGRRISSMRVSAAQDGREAIAGLAALAVLDLPAAGTWTPAPPSVAPAPRREAGSLAPEQYRNDGGAHWLGHTEHMPPIFQRVMVAPRLGGIPFGGRPLAPGGAAETGGWITLPRARPIDAAYVALCTDVWWPPAFGPLGRPAVAPTIDLTIHVRADIPPQGLPDQPVLGWYRTTAAQGGLMEEDAALFLADGTLLAHSRQLAIFMPLE